MPKCVAASGAYNADEPGYFDETAIVAEHGPELDVPAGESVIETSDLSTSDAPGVTEDAPSTPEQPVEPSLFEPAVPTEPQFLTLPKLS